MILSEDTKKSVFDAIHQPVMEERMAIQGRRKRTKNAGEIRQFDQIDNELFYIDCEIYKRVLIALNVKESQ